jgi:hypothetical protein
MDSRPGLSALQLRVLRLIRDRLPEAEGFVLAGGAALIVHGIVDRPTEDLDLFTTEPRDVPLAVHGLLRLVAEEGLTGTVIRSGTSFTRLVISDDDSGAQTLVDLAWDARLHEPEDSSAGPVLTVHELAADKALALFGRAEARDLVDVRALVDRLGGEAILQAAAEKDPGFDRYVFAQMLALADNRPDADFPLDPDELAELRRWARAWRTRLASDLLG